MVTIADTTAANLFVTPALPGDHYNMTADLYSGTTLVERQNVNLTRILGFSYFQDSVSATTHIDASQLGLFYFESKSGTTSIP